MHEKENKPGRSFPRLPELTYKTRCRIFAAALEIPIASYLGVISALNIENESKARSALSVLAVAAMSFLVSDGAVDLIKGTHHYLGLKTWRVFQNKAGKEKIDKAIQDEIFARDKKRSDFK